MIHLFRRMAFVALFAFAATGISAKDVLKSPDGNYVFTLRQHNGRLLYSITFKGRETVKESEMGIDLENRLFESALGIPNDDCSFWGENLKLESVDTASVDNSWKPLYGENAVVRDRYNAMTLHYIKGDTSVRNDDKDYDKRRFYQLDIQVRAYNEGVAFRYYFPEQNNGLFLNITRERTVFTMPEGTMAWHETWAQGPFSLLPLKDWKDESERPLLMKLSDGTYVALLEAAMTDYARGKFCLAAENVVAVSMYGGVEAMSPYDTPWRVVMAGDNAADIVNNKDIVLNLNEPSRYENLADNAGAYIRPGKAYRCGRLEREYIMRGIAFAEKMGMQYIELDSRWYGPEQLMSSSATTVSPERDFTIEEVCDSARRHGLGVWVYVNQRALYNELDILLPLYRKWGVCGIKFGFVQVGNQMWTTWLHDAVRKCDSYGIMVDIHDEYRPTGFSRTCPNLLTQEGIRGNEEMPDATHNVILPFTRYICGAADYTLCYYNGRVKNTRGHQLAMAAVYYSPLQFMFWYDDPKVFDGGEELLFWSAIPTVFDESRCLKGEVGEYVVQARRSGDTWFIGAMTNTEARDITIETDALLEKGKYEVTIMNDDPTLTTKSKVRTVKRNIKAGETLKLHLQPSGGAAVMITKAAAKGNRR